MDSPDHEGRFTTSGVTLAHRPGYIIPIPVVEHFLKDVADHGEYVGFPSISLGTQTLESPVLRKAMGLAKDQKGPGGQQQQERHKCMDSHLPVRLMPARAWNSAPLLRFRAVCSSSILFRPPLSELC